MELANLVLGQITCLPVFSSKVMFLMEFALCRKEKGTLADDQI